MGVIFLPPSVVKHIMEQHGGGIEIESEEGRGTRVCLWLPNGPSTRRFLAYGYPEFSSMLCPRFQYVPVK